MAKLSQEIAAYDRVRRELECDHFGEWVIVHDEQVFNFYDDFQNAADAAVQNFGRGPFLLRRVGEPPLTLPASLLYHPVNADG